MASSALSVMASTAFALFATLSTAHPHGNGTYFKRNTASPEKPGNHPEQQLPPGITVDQMSAADPPRDPADVQNWFGTSLYGFENCGDGGAIIKQAYKDANKIVNLKGVKSEINWDAAAAFEYLGPPALNKAERSQIQAVIANVATVYDGWAPGIFANWIHARCDDPKERCTIRCSATTEQDDDHDQPIVRAYSQNPSSVNGLDWPYINFCPGFFGLPSLDTAVRQNSDEEAAIKYHVESYVSTGKSNLSPASCMIKLTDLLTASTFLHELFHLDLAADSVNEKPNPKVRDMKISYFRYDRKTGQRELSPLEGAYGASLAKKSTGYYVQRNDDSLGRFALAKYIESKIGDYPFLPQVYQKLHRIHGPPPRPNSIGVSWDLENDSVAVLNLTLATLGASVPDDDGVCPWGRETNDDDFVVKVPHPDSAYPDWYHAQQEKWLDMINESLGSDTCSLNLTQIWTCEPADSNLYARVTIMNPKGDVMYSTPGSTRTPGQPINDNNPLKLKKGNMEDTLTIVGEHVNDYIQFYYKDLAWTSWTKDGSATCKLVGDNWGERGPENCPSNAVTRQFECQYPC